MDTICDYRKKKGHGIDQCFKFKLVDYTEWWNNLKGKTLQFTPRLAAKVFKKPEFLGTSPLDTSNSLHLDIKMVSAVYQVVLKMMQHNPSSLLSNIFQQSLFNFASIVSTFQIYYVDTYISSAS